MTFLYSYVSPVAGCGSDVPFIEMTLTQHRKWDSNPEPLSYKYGASLPNNKILDLSKLKANAYDKILVNVIEKLKPDFRRVKNIVGKRENVGTSIFSFSYNVFRRSLFLGRKNQELYVFSCSYKQILIW